MSCLSYPAFTLPQFRKGSSVAECLAWLVWETKTCVGAGTFDLSVSNRLRVQILLCDRTLTTSFGIYKQQLIWLMTLEAWKSQGSAI